MDEFKIGIRSRRSETGEWPPRQSRVWIAIALAVLIGALGGALFWILGLPLPWMLGAMSFSMLAAFLRVPAALPTVIRQPTMVIIGVMLGAAFRPEALAQVVLWWPSFLGMAVLLVVAASLTHRRVRSTTAYFAGIPGGLAEMVALGSQRGGDAVAIALLHSGRIFFVVFSFSFLLDAVAGGATPAKAAERISIFDSSLADFAWFAFCAIAGLQVGRVLRLPGYFLVGPMLVSAAVHVFGASHFVPPVEVIGGAQVLLGTSLGLSFADRPMRQVVRILAISLSSVTMLTVLTATTALLVSRMIGVHWTHLMPAYSPGGLAEMSIVALALGFDVALVAAHHVTRIFLIVLCASISERWLGRR
jgi:uncharacterized protein